MNDAGILLRTERPADRQHAKRLRLAVAVGADLRLRWKRTLFVDGAAVPWDLLPAGFHFLERWDAAAPLWRYGLTAQDVGTKAERARTLEICRDLRLLLHEPGLLFVKDSEAGRALLEAFADELRHGDDRQLAFLRARYLVKPKFCDLPRSWLAEVRDHKVPRRGHTGPAVKLVDLEIEPGRFVRVKPGSEDLVRKQFTQMRRGRGRR